VAIGVLPSRSHFMKWTTQKSDSWLAAVPFREEQRGGTFREPTDSLAVVVRMRPTLSQKTVAPRVAALSPVLYRPLSSTVSLFRPYRGHTFRQPMREVKVPRRRTAALPTIARSSNKPSNS
jgi:hypothetical protein